MDDISIDHHVWYCVHDSVDDDNDYSLTRVRRWSMLLLMKMTPTPTPTVMMMIRIHRHLLENRIRHPQPLHLAGERMDDIGRPCLG